MLKRALESRCFTTGCGTPESRHATSNFLFFGKASTAYQLAKVIIKFVNISLDPIDADPNEPRRLKVLFLPDYYVSRREAYHCELMDRTKYDGRLEAAARATGIP